MPQSKPSRRRSRRAKARSQRSRAIIIRDTLAGVPLTLTVQRQDLEEASDLLTRLDPQQAGPELVARLCEAVNWEVSRTVSVKPRGIQAGRHGIGAVHWDAGWTYLFVERELDRPEPHWVVRLALRALSDQLASCTEADRKRSVTALLVRTRFRAHWQRWSLRDPLGPDGDAGSFYRTFISPRLQALRSRVAKDPRRLNPDDNPRLRRIVKAFLLAYAPPPPGV